MYRVEYFCPRQSPYWQGGAPPTPNLQAAIGLAQVLKPPRGAARVLDQSDSVVYQI